MCGRPLFANPVTFRVDLKACLGLTNTASSSGKSEAGFWVMFFMGHTFVVPTIQYYCTV